MVLDAVVVAALAVITMQGLRRWCGDRYLVPSGSMEPVLHGDPVHGDIVFVDKLARASAQKRGDIVVVQDPHDPGKQLVKRIAACGDDREEKFLHIGTDGDIWLGPDPDRMHRVQKEPIAARGQRVPWASAPGTAASRGLLEVGAPDDGPGPWSLPAACDSLDVARRLLGAEARAARWHGEVLVPPGFAGTKKPVDASFVDATGARGVVGNDVPVPDVGLDVEITAVPEHVLAVIDAERETLAFDWQPRTGRVLLWRDGEDVATAKIAPVAPPLRLEFGLLDDRAFLCASRERAGLVIVPRKNEWPHAGFGLRTVAYVGGVDADANASFAFRSLRAFHDVHIVRSTGIVGVTGPLRPMEVPTGRWFLLGDSSFDSHDSRQFGAVDTRLFLGTPCCVLGPWPRTRWVRP
jgi:signal peptidase I